MGKIDLDAARKARAEKTKEKHTLRFGGKSFPLPPEFPYAAVEALTLQDFRTAMERLLDGKVADFWALNPSVDDLRELTENLGNLYLPDQGNPPASGDSS